MTYPDNPYGMSPVSLFPQDAPFRMDNAGLGCVLIQRHVFETIEPPWFDLKADGYGSDMYFFTKCRKAGFENWCNPVVKCDQIDYTVVTHADYERRLAEDPHFARSGAIIAPPEVVDEVHSNGAG